jgi:hypothetical protein
VTRRLIDNLFLLWLAVGGVFWLLWVIVAPAYDQGVFSGAVFFGAYTLGIPYLLSTVLFETIVGGPLTVAYQAVAMVVGAAPVLFTHRIYHSMRRERQPDEALRGVEATRPSLAARTAAKPKGGDHN